MPLKLWSENLINANLLITTVVALNLNDSKNRDNAFAKQI